MSKIKHVVQIGMIEGNIRLYLEDYVYTYLKREEEEGETKRFYLFGEREKEETWENLYIYGMSDSRQEEKTYFKEFGFLGTLRLREEEKYFTPASGKERLLDGLLIFYADNQPMQEFLIDRNKDKVREEKQSLRERGIRREDFHFHERPAMPETLHTQESFPVAGVIASAAVLFLLVSAIVTGNGFEKLQRMKHLVQETLSYEEENAVEEEALVVEEVRMGQAGEEKEPSAEETTTENIPAEEAPGNESPEASETGTSEENIGEAVVAEETLTEETEEAPKEEAANEFAEYIVKTGDTLAAICKKQYGSLERMGEICRINEIKNADHIAPGQKIYLPR